MGNSPELKDSRCPFGEPAHRPANKGETMSLRQDRVLGRESGSCLGLSGARVDG